VGPVTLIVEPQGNMRVWAQASGSPSAGPPATHPIAPRPLASLDPSERGPTGTRAAGGGPGFLQEEHLASFLGV